MNYFKKTAATAGVVVDQSFRFVRLNYFYVTAPDAAGTNSMNRPNILLVQINGLWRKLHEGEVLDTGEVRTRNIPYDFFTNQFPGTEFAPDFELEFSDTPLTDQTIGNKRLFIDGVALTLNAGAVKVINCPPQRLTTAAVQNKQGLTVFAPMRRLSVDNQSGQLVCLGRAPGALIGNIPTGRIWTEDLRGEVVLANPGGVAASFYYQFYFEWV